MYILRLYILLQISSILLYLIQIFLIYMCGGKTDSRQPQQFMVFFPLRALDNPSCTVKLDIYFSTIVQ